MTAAEFAAYLGALSWLPQIYTYFARPKLKLVTNRTIEVGYTTLGPIVNVGMAISVSHRDTLIEKIELLVKSQESGGQQRFIWIWLNELQHQITVPSAPMIEIRKNQPALALKVSTLALAEKNIGFQEMTYLSSWSKLVAELSDQFRLLMANRKTASAEPLQQVFGSREYQSLKDFYVNALGWKPGRYDLTFRISQAGQRVHLEDFTMTLTAQQVDRLRANVDQLEAAIRLAIVGEQLVIEGNPQPNVTPPGLIPPVWNWAYPEISPC